ncbi:glycoside hydrolase superfamily [Blyttiomyces helicus]|uniref:Chitinase domain-containing protein 1 n=1 Tax=Blyttiomyces helicus TaxID=388810 RepID=A0A4V1IST8_9FUNG|nr:glycoside hydrolase superfamily [Blyttiomyces helicus]|eukprot:RKO94707.1 glycoside hydrolase superfamily [Blyttiomyces helicus]
MEKYQGWIYPGFPAQNSPTTYRQNKIDVLKPEYFTITDSGILSLIQYVATNPSETSNAYSIQNVADIKANSSEQYVTVSSGITGMRNFFQISSSQKNTINILVSFVVDNGLTGIEIDFENFGQWTSTDYANYKNLLIALSKALHAKGKKLSVCGPTWSGDPSISPFPNWNYADFVSLGIDQMCPMIYDNQYDVGGGAPVCPFAWLESWAKYLLTIFGPEVLVAGIPAYGYTATSGKWDIKILTLDQVKALNGYSSATRDPASGEMILNVGNKVFVSSDSTSLDLKRQILIKCGVKYVSVWHLGGNDWFTS